jgi:O-antigen ligase
LQMNLLAERTVARILGFGSAFVAVIVVTGSVTDPVNVTKLLALGGVAVAAAFATGFSGYGRLWKDSKAAIAAVVIFVVMGISAIANSDAPWVQNFYGEYGRNTGFLAYILLILVFLSALALRAEGNFKLLMWGLILAGVVNVVYCLWVVVFGDFIPWNNPYGNILGTFGNPNFIGAFLGFFASAMVAFVIKNKLSIYVLVAAGLVFLLAVYEIIDSSAIQGRVVVVAGLAIVGFYLIRSTFNSVVPQLGYIALVGVAGTFALLGALQKGPLTAYIYKTSVSLRGEYWQAGWNMALEKPFTGVGFDAYGDWYRKVRDAQALILPGPDTVTNAAHNVPFDVLASGGWPLFIPYVFIVLLAFIAIVKVTLREKKYNPVFVAMTVAWVGYQLQSIISINQIGLAIWGWLFSGALIAYEVSTRNADAPAAQEKTRKGPKPRTAQQTFSPTLLAGIGLVIGGLIACPPYSADNKWRNALASSSVEQLEAALVTGYLYPANSNKYASAVGIFEQNKFPDQAYKYAKIAVEFNANDFDSWKILYSISKSSPEEKADALANMKRLDPLNPALQG